jgi:CRP/FNR family transcriptional regulator
MSEMPRIQQWLGLFPALRGLEPPHLEALVAAVRFKELKAGQVAYQPGWACPDYVMCMDGLTRVFKRSESGREILLYRVSNAETCVLTTSCLLAQETFPAESVAERDTLLAAIPASVFHAMMKESAAFQRFVFENYGLLLSSLITLVDEVTFSSLDLRLARHLLREADAAQSINTTHQQLALDLGSVREVISRHLREWERMGWLEVARGSIRLTDRDALARYCQGERPT